MMIQHVFVIQQVVCRFNNRQTFEMKFKRSQSFFSFMFSSFCLFFPSETIQQILRPEFIAVFKKISRVATDLLSLAMRQPGGDPACWTGHTAECIWVAAKSRSEGFSLWSPCEPMRWAACLSSVTDSNTARAKWEADIASLIMQEDFVVSFYHFATLHEPHCNFLLKSLWWWHMSGHIFS